MKRTLLIPDVHGRTFWRAPVSNALSKSDDTKIVFMGDYLDPYPQEGILPFDALLIFKEIIALKKAHPENIHLLLGNHDLGYVDRRINVCRRNEENANFIKRLILDNLSLFDLAWEKPKDGGGSILVTHAGVGKGWLKANEWFFGAVDRPHASLFNDALHSSSTNDTRFEELMETLTDISFYRGGKNANGSLIWADIAEFVQKSNLFDDIIQITGHTQVTSTPIALGQYTPNVYCLDCQRSFWLEPDGTVTDTESQNPVELSSPKEVLSLLL